MAAPIPIPAFAPVERPEILFEEDGEVLVARGLADVSAGVEVVVDEALVVLGTAVSDCCQRI